MPTKAITEEQIKHMINRFLSWLLPADFRPDSGISAATAIRALIAERDAAVAAEREAFAGGFTAARQRAEAIVQRFVADQVYAASIAEAERAIATEIHLMRPEGAMDA